MKHLFVHLWLLCHFAGSEFAKLRDKPMPKWFSLIAFLLFYCLLIPTALGQKKGMTTGSGDPSEKPASANLDTAKANAYGERYLQLTTKFKHKGVDFQSKSGIGCVISASPGQRILAIPLSMTKPVDVIQGNEKLSIPCSMLLATKNWSTGDNEALQASFAERADEFPWGETIKPSLKKPLMESELRIQRALDNRGEV